MAKPDIFGESGPERFEVPRRDGEAAVWITTRIRPPHRSADTTADTTTDGPADDAPEHTDADTLLPPG
jgi:hypothetical protein